MWFCSHDGTDQDASAERKHGTQADTARAEQDVWHGRLLGVHVLSLAGLIGLTLEWALAPKLP
jgi:hypothetical protein